MPRLFLAAALLSCLGVSGGCATNDTSIGETDSRVNGVGCDSIGDEQGACTCAYDKRWLCAGQNSVTCPSTYGSGGGRLLVNAENGCEMVWGWRSSCSDGRIYGVNCNGLQCACTVDGQAYGEPFFTPRCAENTEASIRCGFSFVLPPNWGSAPHQGYPCTERGAKDEETGCVCSGGGWDCPTQSGCRLAGEWGGTIDAPELVIDADGTLFFPGGTGLPRESFELERDPGQSVFWGTWQLEGTRLFVRTLDGPNRGCDAAGPPTGHTPTDLSMMGLYEVTFEDACATLRFDAVSDACTERSASFDGFRGARLARL